MNYREEADRILSDVGPVYALTRAEARMLAHTYFGSEPCEVVDGIAEALYHEFKEENWK